MHTCSKPSQNYYNVIYLHTRVYKMRICRYICITYEFQSLPNSILNGTHSPAFRFSNTITAVFTATG